MSSDPLAGQEDPPVLGYLLKHAHLQLTARTTGALKSFGIDSRLLGVLRLLARAEPRSQQEVAESLGVDRTTMVGLLDDLAGKGLVSRHPQAGDRRRNVVELTDAGRHVFRRAAQVEQDAEQAFLASLSADDQQCLRASLATIVTSR